MTTAEFVEYFSTEALRDGQHSASLRHEIDEHGNRILINYGTPIAFITADGVYGITQEKYSATTSKHVSRTRAQFHWPDDAETLTSAQIEHRYGLKLYGRMGNWNQADYRWTVRTF